MSRIALLSLLLLSMFLSTTGLVAQELYVSPQGEDGNPGTRQQPLATLQAAVDKALEGAGGTIWLADGTYPVMSGIQVKQTGKPLVIQAQARHQARVSGAKRVGQFRPLDSQTAQRLILPAVREHVLVADLRAQGFPALSQLPAHYQASGSEEVFWNGSPLQSARWPNEGFATFTEVIDAGASDPVHWVTREVYRPGSFRFPIDRPKQWDFSRGIYLHGFWCYEWSDEVLRAASYNAETGELRFAAKHTYGIGNPWKKGAEHQFYALHVLEELDQPGEYYLDRQQNLLYLWPPGEVDGAEVVISLCADPLLQATGVNQLTLQGLVLECGRNWGIQLRNWHWRMCERLCGAQHGTGWHFQLGWR